MKVWATNGKGPPFIVETRAAKVDVGGEEHDLVFGRIFNNDGTGVGPEVPIDSIARWAAYTDFKPYEGDPSPILAAFAAAVKGNPTA